MAKFTCPNCNAPADRLIIYDGPLGCHACVMERNESNPNLHQNTNPILKVTHAERMRIITRKKDKDGRWKADPKWRCGYEGC